MESIGRVLIEEIDIVQQDGVLEFAKLRRIGLLDDLLIAIQIFEHFLRRTQGLLKDVVNSGEPLHGLVEHQQCDHEAGELARGQCAALDLDASVGDQADDGESSEAFDERRRERLLGDVAQIARFKPRCRHGEAVGFDVLGSKRLHDLMAADGFLQDLIQLGRVILRSPSCPADAPPDAQRRHQHERQHREAHQREAPVLLDYDT